MVTFLRAGRVERVLGGDDVILEFAQRVVAEGLTRRDE